MRVAAIGRTEVLFETALRLRSQGHEIALIVTSKEAPEYTKTSEDFRVLSESWHIPFVYSSRIEKSIAVLKSLPDIDIAVSVNYSSVIPKTVLDLFPLGVLNAHGGDLPKYRGNACQAWAIINGEDHVGLCIHRMVGGELDSGDILCRDYYPLYLETKVTEVDEWIRQRTPELFSEALQRLKEDPAYVLERQSKDPKDALRCYPRRPEDGLIDWSKSNVEILRLINACNKPYAGAFCEFEGREVIIWDASLAQEENFLAIPGQVTLIGQGFVEVATGFQKIRVNEIEIEGKTMRPDRLIKSIRKRFA